MRSEITIFIPRTCYIDCIYHLQYSSLCKINGVLTLGNALRSGDFDMPLSTVFLHSTWAWGSGDVVDRCFTHKFMCYYRILKRWNLLFHILNNSQMYFRNIPICLPWTYKTSLSLQVMYCKGTMSIVLKSMSGYLGLLLLCLQRRLSQLSEGIEIIKMAYICDAGRSFKMFYKTTLKS